MQNTDISHVRQICLQTILNIKHKKNMKIALIGYGKMGKMIEQIAKDRGHEIVSIIDVDNQ